MPVSPFRRRPRAALALLAGALALAALSAAAPRSLAAQERLSGRVVRAGEGVPGARVTLHRVRREGSGPVDSVSTAAGGAFSLTLPAIAPAKDTTDFTVFFATAEVDGVRYFGPPLHPGAARTGYAIEVFDTTSARAAADSVRVVSRNVAMVPADGGGWEVGEVVRLANGSRRTLVPADGGKPVVGFPVPEGIAAFEVGEGEVAPDEVARVGSRVWLTGPFPPGTREVFVRYRLGPAVAELPIEAGLATDTLNVFVRQPAAGIEAEGLDGPHPFQAEGQSFARYSAYRLTPAAKARVTWDVPTPSPVDPRIAAMVLTALVLAAGGFAALKRGGGSPPVSPSPAGGGGSTPEEDVPAAAGAAAAGGEEGAGRSGAAVA
jgi:hypothetical protein